MKKNFMWLLMGLCALTFTACGSDDDNSGTPQGGDTTISGVTLSQVVGTWELFHAKGYQTIDGVKHHEWDEPTNPDWLIIKPDGTWQYMKYSTVDSNRHLQYGGSFAVENGYIVVNDVSELGIQKMSMSGDVLMVEFISTEIKSGKTYVDYETQSWRKI